MVTPAPAQPRPRPEAARVAFVPWDDATGLPSEIGPAFPSSVLHADPTLLCRTPVRLRATHQGDIDLLAASLPGPVIGQAVLLRTPVAGPPRRVAIAPPRGAGPGWRVLDAVADAAGAVTVLEMVGSASNQHVLRRLGPDGSPRWERRGEVDAASLDLARLRGWFDQLLIDAAGAVYLPATRHRGTLCRVESTDGALQVVADWGEWTGTVALDGAGRVFFVRVLDAADRRAWVRIDPTTGEETAVVADAQASAALASPLGVDDAGRAYAYHGTTLMRIARNGAVDWQRRVDNIVVSGEGELALSAMSGHGPAAGVDVTPVGSGAWPPEWRQLRLPEHLPTDDRIWQVIGRCGDGGFIVHDGGRYGSAGTLLTYSPDGRLEATSEAPLDVLTAHCTLQPPAYAAVRPDGAVLVAVLCPDGVHVIALAVAA